MVSSMLVECDERVGGLVCVIEVATGVVFRFGVHLQPIQ